ATSTLPNAPISSASSSMAAPRRARTIPASPLPQRERTRSVEHGRELLDLQPLLDGAEVVIGHDVGDRLVAAADRGDQEASRRIPRHAEDAEAEALKEGIANGDHDGRREIDGQEPPALALGELPAALDAGAGPQPLGHADRDDDEQHDDGDEAGH